MIIYDQNLINGFTSCQDVNSNLNYTNEIVIFVWFVRIFAFVGMTFEHGKSIVWSYLQETLGEVLRVGLNCLVMVC